MRTILFKAKKLSDGKWVKGSLVKTPFGTFIEWYEDYACNKEEVDSSTVCQFTGLTDKNGKEIYEGDVFRSDSYPFSSIQDDEIDNYYEIIGWSDEAASFCMVAAKNPKSSVRGVSDGIADGISREKMKDFEVVGNIHEENWQQYGEYFKTEEGKEADND